MKLLHPTPRTFLALAWLTLAVLCARPTDLNALTVTVVTSGNGHPAHQVQWTDSAGLPRTAVLVDQSASGPGYLYQLTYQVNGSPRVCTGPQGTTGYPGDGFVQNHIANGDDRNSLDQSVPGTTSIALGGASHLMITYSMPTYALPDYINANNHTIPTTVCWLFSDGCSYPLFVICQDARATAGNIGADTRSPYGSFNFDGTGQSEVGGASYGDTLKFVTLAGSTAPVTGASGWSDNTAANTVPYAMEWAVPSQADAEWGHVATVPITIQDEGTDRGDDSYTDSRNSQALNGPLLQDGSWAFQILDYLGLDGNSDSLAVEWSKLAWGGNFGRVGGFDNYNYGDSDLDVTQYSEHRNSTADILTGTRTNGMLLAYSVYVVLGTHSGSYLTGSVGQLVTQIENAALAAVSASTGKVITSGPAGVGSATNATIPYSPAGYNPTFAAWNFTMATNTVNATLTPAANHPLSHPLFILNGYTNNVLPASIAVGPGLTNAGVDYFASVDTNGHALWITVNRSITNAMNLVVGPAAGGGPGQPAPVVSSFSPTSGLAGTAVTITGQNLTNASAVAFNGLAAASFTVSSPTQIMTTVPAGASTGVISVTTPGGFAQSAAAFTVPAAAAATNLPIYVDSLLNGFNTGYSWAATVNDNNTSPVYSGTDSIGVTAAQYTALALYHADFNPSAYASLSFWINGGAAGASGLQVLGVTNFTASDQSSAGLYTLPTLASNTWTHFNVPLATLGVANVTNLQGFWFWPTLAGTTTFYVDSIQLNVAAAPTVAVAPSAPGFLVLQLGGLSGQTNWVETSSNLINWTSIATNILTSALATVTNTVNARQKAQFWRVVQLP